ncbi:PAS domain-containing protein [Rufibacter quisquiliarum]|uniref:histidine kinase n=1 Tax=Rufibacter quisquiliarum TaxID=1549639 RepID=A0A839GNI1_9BACT|nr:PAS domain-containing protein [Rufibacter quisquiliarum]MBA9078369.1 PAS domain S-box-containing protein [Rufibacter quisquiliarum]
MDFFDYFINVPENIVVVSPELKILAATNTYLKTTMKTREEILGKVFLKEVYQNPAVSFEENPVVLSIKRAMQTKQVDYLDVLRYDLEKSAADGGGYETRYWEASHTPVLDEAGQVRFVIQNTHDVTERELARQASKINEEKFRFLTDAVPQLIHTNDPEGGCTYVNRRWLDYTGLPAEELLGDKWQQTIHPEDLGQVAQRRQNAMTEHVEYQIELRIKSKDGQYRWHLLRSVPMKDADGSVIMRVGSAHDIHSTKIMVQEMLDTNEQLSALSDQVQQAYQQAEDQRATMEQLIMQAPAVFAILRGPQHRFSLVNPRYQQLFPKRELLGKTVAEALPEVVGQGFIQILDSVFETGQPFVAEEIGITLDWHNTGQQEEAFFTTTYQPLVENGQVAGIIAFGYDVTPAVKLRQELESLKNG